MFQIAVMRIRNNAYNAVADAPVRCRPLEFAPDRGVRVEVPSGERNIDNRWSRPHLLAVAQIEIPPVPHGRPERCEVPWRNRVEDLLAIRRPAPGNDHLLGPSVSREYRPGGERDVLNPRQQGDA